MLSMHSCKEQRRDLDSTVISMISLYIPYAKTSRVQLNERELNSQEPEVCDGTLECVPLSVPLIFYSLLYQRNRKRCDTE